MTKKVWLLGCAALSLAACEDFDTASTGASGGFIGELPQNVRAMAAPYQDLNAVKLDPASGCFVYRHAGPVETTLLPLRTRDGRPICTQTEEAPAAT